MTRAISNEMNRNELIEFLSDSETRKEFFSMMKLKNKIGNLQLSPIAVENKTPNTENSEKRFSSRISRSALAIAASLFLLSSLGLYFRFYSSSFDRFQVENSVVTGLCKMQTTTDRITFYSEKDSYCDYKIDGELGLILRMFPESEFSISGDGSAVNLNLNSGTVVFSTSKKNRFLPVRAKVKTIETELLGTTLILSSNQNSGSYKIGILEGAVKVIGTNTKNANIIQAGYSAVLEQKTGIQSVVSEPEIVKIETKTLLRYRNISENSKMTLEKKTVAHSSEEKTLLQKAEVLEKHSSEPVFKIRLKNGEKFVGQIQEQENVYLLIDQNGDTKEIPKKDILELELVR
ncbi:iron dicitrate transport regulator FecR [Leptospira sp. WS92.C1]